MSAERVARLNRLVEARRSAAYASQVELANLERAVEAARDAVALAERAWLASLDGSLMDCRSHDLADAGMFVRSLSQQRDDRLTALRDAAARRDDGRRRLVAARSEVKKLETLVERVGQEASAARARTERRETDELAARLARSA